MKLDKSISDATSTCGLPIGLSFGPRSAQTSEAHDRHHLCQLKIFWTRISLMPIACNPKTLQSSTVCQIASYKSLIKGVLVLRSQGTCSYFCIHPAILILRFCGNGCAKWRVSPKDGRIEALHDKHRGSCKTGWHWWNPGSVLPTSTAGFLCTDFQDICRVRAVSRSPFYGDVCVQRS